MDYLHINAIIRETYMDIPSSCPFPAAWREQILRVISGDSFLQNEAIDNVISYFSLKERDQIPVVVFSNVERHKNTESVGRYTQCLGWQWHGDLVSRNLDSIFRSSFYGETEITDMGLRKATAQPIREERSDAEEITIDLDHDTKRAILTGVMRRWLRHEPAIRIAVPRNVDYNCYVLSAMKAIYAFFPVAVRTEAGFCSYMPDARDTSARFYIGFIPENMADAATLFLDGTGRAAISALNNGTGRNTLDQFIRYLSVAKSDDCQSFLEEVYQDVEGAGDPARIVLVNPRDYYSTGEALALLTMQGHMEDLIPKWQAFYSATDRFTPKMVNRLRRKINQSAIPEEFCAYVRGKCQEKSTLDEVVRQLCEYKAFCVDCPQLVDALWSTFVALMSEKGMACRGLYNVAVKYKAELEPITDEKKISDLLVCALDEELEAVKKISTETLTEIEKVRGQAIGLLENTSASETSDDLEKVAEKIRGYIAELDNKRSAIILENYRNAFRDINNKPAKTSSQINAQVGKAEELIRKMDAENLAEILGELKREIQQFIDDKRSEMHSVGAYFLEIEQKLQAADRISYFAVRKVMKDVDQKKLESAQYQSILNFVERRIPADMVSYEREFEKYYEEPLTLSAVAKLPAFMCHAVVKDICDINKISVVYDQSKSANLLSAEIQGAGFAAKKISGQCGVDVFFEGGFRNSNWFNRVVELTHDQQSMGEGKDLQAVCLKLVENGAYTGEQLVRCVEMFSLCELEFQNLFRYILNGKFSGCTEPQCIRAYEVILKRSRNQQQLLANMELAARAETDKSIAADRAFRKFLKEHRESNGNKKKKWVIPVAIGAAVLVLAGIVAGIWLWNRNGDNDPEPTTEPTEASMPTEPAVIEFPPVLSGFAEHAEVAALLHNGTERKQFDVLHQEVSDMLLGLEQEVRDQALACYAGGQENVVELGENYGSAAWDEYFFWKCWLLKDADIPELQDAFTGSSCEEEKVLAVLRFIHSAVPAPAESDQTDAETEETVPEDAATDEDTTDTADTADVEEKSLTAEQMIGAVSEEAGAVYSRMEESSADMLRMLMLFGADFEKDFAEHQTRVEALLGRTEADVAQILARYGSLPGDAEIYFADSGIKITWSEYLFWECWLIAAREEQAITADVFDAQLHEDVVQILKVLYQLPDIELPVIELPPVVAETEDPAETAETIQGEGASQDTVPPAEEETVAPAEEETETAEEPELPGAAEISAISEVAASAYEKARDHYLTIVDYIRTAG